MSFADAYLLKAGLREALVQAEPHSDLSIIVTVPVYNESGLERCLDSLFLCGTESIQTEVLILINAPEDAPPDILNQNQATLEATRTWIASHPDHHMNFYVWLDHSFGRKEAGVGTARKILMDEAARRFSLIDRPDGIIASMDADAVVEPNYLEALVEHFRLRVQRSGDIPDRTLGRRSGPGSANASGPVYGNESGSAHGKGSGSAHGNGSGSAHGNGSGSAHGNVSGPDGCSIRFEHPVSGKEYPPSVYAAITQYELHLRYYIQSVRFTGYPYAYHTVGSSFAVRAVIYCMEGGMNRRQGGEDFYFIQKVARRGNFSQCNSTCVRPSPRPSDRVPFGTGPVVRRLSRGEEPLMTYDPRPFALLKQLFKAINSPGLEDLSWPEPLQSFLEKQDFRSALEEMERNSASAAAFRKRFWRWFSMFRIMKFLHYARESGYPDVPVTEAASALLRTMDPERTGIPSIANDPKKLLFIYRMLDER